jgi:hypothetical protein
MCQLGQACFVIDVCCPFKLTTQLVWFNHRHTNLMLPTDTTLRTYNEKNGVHPGYREGYSQPKTNTFLKIIGCPSVIDLKEEPAKEAGADESGGRPFYDDFTVQDAEDNDDDDTASIASQDDGEPLLPQSQVVVPIIPAGTPPPLRLAAIHGSGGASTLPVGQKRKQGHTAALEITTAPAIRPAARRTKFKWLESMPLNVKVSCTPPSSNQGAVPIYGTLDLKTMKVTCEDANGVETRITCTQFEVLGGRKGTKNWKKSLVVMPEERKLEDFLDALQPPSGRFVYKLGTLCIVQEGDENTLHSNNGNVCCTRSSSTIKEG